MLKEPMVRTSTFINNIDGTKYSAISNNNIQQLQETDNLMGKILKKPHSEFIPMVGMNNPGETPDKMYFLQRPYFYILPKNYKYSDKALNEYRFAGLKLKAGDTVEITGIINGIRGQLWSNTFLVKKVAERTAMADKFTVPFLHIVGQEAEEPISVREFTMQIVEAVRGGSEDYRDWRVFIPPATVINATSVLDLFDVDELVDLDDEDMEELEETILSELIKITPELSFLVRDYVLRLVKKVYYMIHQY